MVVIVVMFTVVVEEVEIIVGAEVGLVGIAQETVEQVVQEEVFPEEVFQEEDQEEVLEAAQEEGVQVLEEVVVGEDVNKQLYLSVSC